MKNLHFIVMACTLLSIREGNIMNAVLVTLFILEDIVKTALYIQKEKTQKFTEQISLSL